MTSEEQVSRERVVREAQRAILGVEVAMANLGTAAQRARLALQGLLVLPDFADQQDLQVRQGPPELLELQDPLGLQGLRDQQDLRDLADPQDPSAR